MKTRIITALLSILFLGIVSPIFAYFTSLLSTEKDYIVWVGMIFGITSILLTLFIRITESEQKEKMDNELKKLNTTLNEIRNSINLNVDNQQTQNERLENIENELKIYQQKLTSTNLLSIFINRKKEKDYE